MSVYDKHMTQVLADLNTAQRMLMSAVRKTQQTIMEKRFSERNDPAVNIRLAAAFLNRAEEALRDFDDHLATEEEQETAAA